MFNCLCWLAERLEGFLFEPLPPLFCANKNPISAPAFGYQSNVIVLLWNVVPEGKLRLNDWFAPVILKLGKGLPKVLSV